MTDLRIDAPSPALRRTPARESTVIGMVFGAVAAVHLIAVWVPSYWYDEAATLRLARLSPAQFFEFVQSMDAVHAVYAAFMHVWIGLFGESEFVTRLPSVLAIAFGAAGVYAFTRNWTRRDAAVGAAVIFAFLPRMFIQSAEARSFAISTALIVGAALLLVRAMASPRARSWLAYVLVVTLGIYTFAYAALVVPAFVLLADRRDLPRKARLLRAAVVGLIPAALSVPLLIALLQQRGQVSWLVNQPVNIFTVLVEPLFGWAVWMLAGAVAIIGVALWRRTLPWNRVTAALVAWLVLPTVILLAVTVVAQPAFTPRYLMVSGPALAVLCGLALNAWSRRAIVAICLTWCLAAAPLAVGTRLPTGKSSGLDLRSVAETIGQNAQPGDGFLLGSSGSGALRPRGAIAAYPAQFEGLHDLAFEHPFTHTGTYWDALRTPNAQDLAEVSRVWVATRGENPFAALLRESGFHPVSTETITGIDVVLWER